MGEITGVLHFYSETGTEGGHWAVQDERFMNLPTGNNTTCTHCGRYWDKDKYPDEPKPSFTYFVRTKADPEGHYAGFDSPQALPTTFRDEPEGSMNDVWTKKSNAKSLTCYQRGRHLGWREDLGGTWSYEGLHVLKDGDRLTIFAKSRPDQQLWYGVIKLNHKPLFSDDIGGLWIHATQEGFETVKEREAWMRMFLMELPCKLVTADVSDPTS